MRLMLRPRPDCRHPELPSIATAVALAGSLAVLGGGAFQTAHGAATTPPPRVDPAPSAQPTIEAAHTTLGEILVDAKGMTLYRYTADRKDLSNCYAAYGCEALWPIVSPGPGGRVVAGPGAVHNALGVITRKDGKKQVTYGGWPLYTYTVDRKPGQTAGQGFKDARGIWFVVYATPSKNPAPAS